MKKITILLLSVFVWCGGAVAQDEKPQKENKKEGGFLKGLKKGFESTTGIKVSEETLFVYPNLAEWKFRVESCKGSRADGTVKLVISATKLTEGNESQTWCNFLEVTLPDGTKADFHQRANDRLRTFNSGQVTVVDFDDIYKVPVDTKAMDVKFYISTRNRVFEGRRIPIEWVDAFDPES